MQMRTALVTGCSSGFGHELVQELLRRNWRVIATLRKAEARAELFRKEQETAGDRLVVLSLDVTDPLQRRSVLGQVTALTGGKLDCLINNAGYGLFGALEDLSEEQIRAQLETNVFGLLFMTRGFLPLLRAAQGKIIQLS